MTELRMVDSRGEEKEWHDNHCGVYCFFPGSLKSKIAAILGVNIYSVGREIIDPKEEPRRYGQRIFVQTGRLDGTYLLTFEVMDPLLCAKVIEVLETPSTQELRDESERDYHRTCERLGL